MQSAIDGVSLHDLGIIPTPGGPVLHMARPGLFPPVSPGKAQGGLNIGEVYFSETEPGRIKAWKCHMRQTQRLAVPCGRLKIVLYDDREDSPGRLEEYVLGRPDAYRLLCIPPRVWYGFAALGDAPALLCNCPDLPHDPAEALRRDIAEIPYRW